MTRIIPDTADAKRDYWIDTPTAQRLFAEGKLVAYRGLYGNGEVCYGTKQSSQAYALSPIA